MKVTLIDLIVIEFKSEKICSPKAGDAHHSWSRDLYLDRHRDNRTTSVMSSENIPKALFYFVLYIDRYW